MKGKHAKMANKRRDERSAAKLDDLRAECADLRDELHRTRARLVEQDVLRAEIDRLRGQVADGTSDALEAATDRLAGPASSRVPAPLDNFRNDREHMWLALYEDGTFALGNRAGDGFFSVENISVESRHRMAALALNGQPFGFTHEDVRRLRENAYNVPDGYSGNPWMEELAERIAALLPPEAP